MHGTMHDKPEPDTPMTRRDCLAGAGAALLTASQPAVARATAGGRQTSPAGHRRTAPAFRRIVLDK